MFEIVLRLFLLFLCAGAIVVSVQVALWTTKPWWRPVLGLHEEVSVTIEPVGMIEGGKVKSLESRPIASQLIHRVSQIYGALKKDMGEHYAILNEAGVSIPSFSVGGRESFQLVSDTGVNFEVSVFKFDIAGLMNYIHGKLDARDQIKTMIEIGDTKSRLFLDVSRVNGADQRLILDSGPTLNESIEIAACAIAHAYRERDGLFSGLDAHRFCAFHEILEEFQNFIVQSANRVRNGGPINLDEAQSFIDRLESPPLEETKTPVVHLILASLYRLRGDSDAALERLEEAAQRVPDHEFVEANLDLWRTEKAEREADRSELAALRDAPPDEGRLAETYAAIRTQPALAAIRYPEMLERLDTLPRGAEVQVAIFSTGFTYPAEPVPKPEILNAINTSMEPVSDDLNGHGNMVTHLLAALTPSESVKILPVKVMDKRGAGLTSAILQGFQEAIGDGRLIFAIPLGQPYSDDPKLREAVDNTAKIYDSALDRPGLIALAAAGNSGRESQVNVPARLDRVIAVGGTSVDQEWAPFSPGPEGVPVAGPATGILTTISGERLREVNGTSFSAIIVSALFALAKSAAPDLTQDAILQALQETSGPAEGDGPAKIDALAFIDRIALRANQ